MASIYDVNAAIQKPNMLAAVQQGYVFGTQQRQQREAEADRNMLRGLAPKIIEGDPNAYAQAAAIDPQAAQTYDDAGTNQLRKLKGGMDYLKAAMESGNPQRIAAAEAMVGPFVSRIANKPWTPGSLTADPAAFEQAYARVSMLGSDPQQEPAGYRQAHLTAIAAGYQPGTPEYQRAMQVAAGTAPRAIPPGYTTRSYRDANGQEVVELVQIRGEGAGQQMPAGGGAPAPQPATSGNGDPKMDAIVKAANDMRAAGIPTAQIDAWMQQLSQNTPGVEVGAPQAMPAGGPVPMPAPQTLDRVPINSYGGGSLPAGRGQTDADRARAAAEQAAMVEAARLRAQLSLAPQQAEADADAARLKKEAEAQAERNATAEKRRVQATETIATLNEAIKWLPEATGGVAGQIRDAAGRAVNQSTEGSRATARLKLLAAKLVANVPRFEGPQSNIDVQFYREAAGDLANPDLSVGERQAAAELMLEIAQRYANPPSAPAPAPSAAPTGQYQPGQVIEANGRRFRVIGGDPNDPDVEEI